MSEFPSKETQWKKGESGNPNGRPKGTKNLKTLIEKVWNEEITDSEGNKKIQGLLAVKALVDKAKKGDVSAFKALAERLEGQPKQEIDQNITGKAVIEVVRPSYDKDENNT